MLVEWKIQYSMETQLHKQDITCMMLARERESRKNKEVYGKDKYEKHKLYKLV